MQSCRSSARNLLSSGYTQTICSQGGGPCEGFELELELELELIQTQMAQKPMLRAEVYAHAMRASQNRKKEVRREKKV
jgi:hypothetical protein